jgi:lipopolysaccharide transport system permease protein
LSFPVIAVGACLLNFAIVMAVFLVFLLLVGRMPGLSLLGLLPVLLVQTAFALGLGIVLGSINVFFRDVQQALGIGLQLWFWLTPIVYVPSILSERTVALLSWNPMWPLMNAYRDIFLNNQWPDWASLLYPLALSVLLLGAGFVVFKRLQHDILDEV